MTNQETFDIVAKHLLTQNKKCEAPSGHLYPTIVCKYRNKEGLKCAAGVLIPDEEYKVEMEGNNCESYIVAEVLEKHGHDPHFVRKLQYIHDANSPHTWEDFLQNLAAKEGLVFNEEKYK